MFQIQNLKTKMSQKLINSSQLLLQQRIWTNSFIQAKQLKSSIFQHVHHSRSRQLIFLFAPSVVFANKRLLVASGSSMLLPSAHTQTFKESLLWTSKGYSALINGSKSILAFSANSIPSLQFYWDEKRNKSQFLLDKTRQLPHFSPKKLGKDQYYCVPKNVGTTYKVT